MNTQPTVWISGGTQGIGLSCAKRLVASGFNVVVSSRSNSGEIDNSKIEYIRCDVSKSSDVVNAYTQIVKSFANVDILINCAATGTFSSFADTTLDEFEAMINTNIKGVFQCTKAVLNDMIQRKSGLILNISSVSAINCFENASIYSATKAATVAMFKSLRKEVRKHNIKIVNILPGATATRIWDEATLNSSADKMISVEDISDSVLKIIQLSYNSSMMIEEIIIRPQNGDL